MCGSRSGSACCPCSRSDASWRSAPAAVVGLCRQASRSRSTRTSTSTPSASRALAAAAAAVALTIVGARFSDTRTVLVGTAFAAMAALLALHGLSTPGFLFGYSGVLALTGGATLPVGAAILAFSVLPAAALRARREAAARARGRDARRPCSGSDCWRSSSRASSRPCRPRTATARRSLLVIGLALFGVLAMRAFRTFLLTRRIADLVVTIGLVWLAHVARRRADA